MTGVLAFHAAPSFQQRLSHAALLSSYHVQLLSTSELSSCDTVCHAWCELSMTACHDEFLRDSLLPTSDLSNLRCDLTSLTSRLVSVRRLAIIVSAHKQCALPFRTLTYYCHASATPRDGHDGAGAGGCGPLDVGPSCRAPPTSSRPSGRGTSRAAPQSSRRDLAPPSGTPRLASHAAPLLVKLAASSPTTPTMMAR